MEEKITLFFAIVVTEFDTLDIFQLPIFWFLSSIAFWPLVRNSTKRT